MIKVVLTIVIRLIGIIYDIVISLLTRNNQNVAKANLQVNLIEFGKHINGFPSLRIGDFEGAFKEIFNLLESIARGLSVTVNLRVYIGLLNNDMSVIT